MMNKILKKIDNLDVVKFLRILAVVIFVIELSIIPFGYYKNILSMFNGVGVFLSTIWMFLSVVIRALYMPAVLIGVAEIIKIMKEKIKNDGC